MSSLFGKLSDGATRIYAEPKMVKNGKKIFAKIRFRPYTFIIRGLDFFFNFADRKRGGGRGVNPYGQADRRIYVFIWRLP